MGISLVSAALSAGCGDDAKGNPGSSGSAAGGTSAQTDDGSATSAGKGGKGGNGGSGNKSNGGSSGSNTSGSSTDNNDDEDCAKLDACCPTVKDATLKAAACQSAIRDCSLQYAVLHASGECQDDPGAQLPEVTLDGAWSSPQTLSVLSWQGQSISVSTPTVLPCGEGDAVAAWYQNGGSVGQVQAARYSAASKTWQVYSQIDQNSGLQPSQPYLAVNTACDALVVWKERLPVLGGVHDDFALVAASYSAAGTISDPFTIEAESGNEPQDIALGLAPDGTGILSYAYNGGIVRRLYTPGAGFAASTPLGTLSVGSWSFAMLDDGTALQVYTESEVGSSTYSKSFQLYTDDWSEPAELLPAETAGSSPRVVAAGDRFYVLYQAEPGVGLLSVSKDGTVSEPELIDVAPAGAAFTANGDHLQLAWRVDNSKIMGSERDGSGAWSTPKQLSADIHEALEYAIAVDPQGRAMLVYNDSKYAVFANRRDSHGEWLGVHALSTAGMDPTVVANDQGSFFAAYYGSQGGLTNPQVANFTQVFTPTDK
ncbi:MAG TPA: hypothetical protein VEQ58_18770 [Polyangiaceae bacterium]|nr:hypothetical protein [Polyangiaceae bacterium]